MALVLFLERGWKNPQFIALNEISSLKFEKQSILHHDHDTSTEFFSTFISKPWDIKKEERMSLSKNGKESELIFVYSLQPFL
jgi:hypothetical protein